MAPKPKDPAAAEEPTEPPPPTCGFGKFYYPDGITYEGEWKLVFPEPLVQTDVEAKSKPKGKKDDMPTTPSEPPKRVRHGKGTYIHGAYVYEGEFSEDAITGQGKFKYASGACYEGTWLNGQYYGKGRYSWPDGRSYEGDWVENKMHGQGIYTDATGHKWEGQFFNGHGPGLAGLC